MVAVVAVVVVTEAMAPMSTAVCSLADENHPLVRTGLDMRCDAARQNLCGTV